MSKETNIAWTNSSWNPWSGCFEVSEGCDNCYAKQLAERYRGKPAFPNGFDLTLRPHKYDEPLKWKEPREIFVNSMSDFWLGTVPPAVVKSVWKVMLEADWHIFQILTKRPVNMLRMIRQYGLELAPHIWLGVSVENQRWADNRIPLLLEVPTPGVRFLSCEPLLGAIDLRPWIDCFCDERCNAYGFTHIPDLHWVIDGGESGPGRRAAPYDWFRAIRDACIAGGVPYFHKQGNAYKSGQDMELDGRTWEQHPNRVDRTVDRTTESGQAEFSWDARA